MRKRAATDEVHPVEVRREADGLADHATLCRERTFRGDEVCAEGGAVLLVRGEERAQPFTTRVGGIS